MARKKGTGKKDTRKMGKEKMSTGKKSTSEKLGKKGTLRKKDRYNATQLHVITYMFLLGMLGFF